MQVVLFMYSLVHVFLAASQPMPIVFCYDDACHLLARLQSLIGLDWEAAFLVCMIIALDRLYMLNHLNGNCLSELHPNKFPQLRGANTQSAEQTNSFGVRVHVNTATKKNSGGFRFHLLRMADIHNANMVSRNRYVDESITRRKAGKKDRAYYDKLAMFKAAEGRFASSVPDVPPEYLADDGATKTHLDVKAFKVHWDSGRLRDNRRIAESRVQGPKYREKKILRRMLMNFAVKQGVAKSIPEPRLSAWNAGP